MGTVLSSKAGSLDEPYFDRLPAVGAPAREGPAGGWLGFRRLALLLPLHDPTLKRPDPRAQTMPSVAESVVVFQESDEAPTVTFRVPNRPKS